MWYLNNADPRVWPHLTRLPFNKAYNTDNFCDELSCCLHDSALASLPKTHRSSCIPGWNDRAHSLKEKANFWHHIWRQNGCPKAGTLHQIKKHTKSRYKYEIRRLKRREQHIRREKMATALASSNTKSFWQRVHKVNRSNKATPVSSVDGISGDVGISQLFSTKLQSLLNCQECPEREALLSSCTSSLCPEVLAQSTISEECVAKAFTHLKPGKSDGSHTAWFWPLGPCCSCLVQHSSCSVHSHPQTWLHA